jgi:alpha-ketoglutarate-dependent taurine dioxygenase
MTQSHNQIKHPAAWLGEDLSKEKISFDLMGKHIRAFERILLEAKTRGLNYRTASESDFRLHEIEDDLEAISQEVLNGRGVLVVRNWPVERFSVEEMGLIFWAFGKHIGQTAKQSRLGDRLVYVRDLGQPTVRGTTSNKLLPVHTDFHSVVGLLAIHSAKSGGETRIVSALECYSKIAQCHPEYLRPLFEGYQVRYKGDPGEPDMVSSGPVPVFSEVNGQINTFIVRPFMENAASEPNVPLSGLPLEALDYFQDVAESPEMCFTFLLEPGEASIMCNHSVLHARNEFEDWPELERRRLLLRLWLSVDDVHRPIHPVARDFFTNFFAA